MQFNLAGREIDILMGVDPNDLTDSELLHAINVSGCPEPEVANAMVRAIKPGDFVIDGGANIGFFTVLMATLVGPTGSVLAFEPGQNNLHKLDANIKLNNLSNVEVCQQPLWNKADLVRFYMCADGGKNSLEPHPDTRGASVHKAVKLNSYDVPKHLKLIKLDIEGAEEMALRGGTKFLRAQPYLILELNVEALAKFDSSPSDICEFLHYYGYSPFLLHPNGALPTFIPRHIKVQPNRLNWNVLFSTFEMVAKAWPEIAL
jgi:FkbM family methyltransferase